tara:strand:+ start:6613 stop:7437 length:825 start_codon:yes stop_codon:yes gene_type:complete
MNKNLKNIFELRNKVIVITGAGGLLGKQHAEIVAAYGGIPILIDINSKSINEQSLKLNEKYKINSIPVIVDITNEKEVIKSADFIKEKFGKINALINNASRNPTQQNVENTSDNLENFSIENWNKDLAVGLTGSFLCSKYYGAMIAKNKNGGSIINISSDLGIISPDQRLYNDSDEIVNAKPISYSVVKSGLIGLTKYLSTYWVKNNVRCNAICPGGVKNNQSEIFIEKVTKLIPLNRLASPDEYQSTILWMLSESSSYLNGAIISVDGGRTSW